MIEDFFRSVKKNTWLSFVSAVVLTIILTMWSVDMLPDKLQEGTASIVWGSILACLMLWGIVIAACCRKVGNIITILKTKHKIRKTQSTYDLALFERGLDNYPNSFENVSTTESSNLISLGIFKRSAHLLGYLDHGTNEFTELIKLEKKYHKDVKKRIDKYKRGK